MLSKKKEIKIAISFYNKKSSSIHTNILKEKLKNYLIDTCQVIV